MVEQPINPTTGKPKRGRPRKSQLEKEAEQFANKKKAPPKNVSDTVTPRQQLAATILGGLLANSPRGIHENELLSQAFSWADKIIRY